jgi:putative ABC transport system permease protein
MFLYYFDLALRSFRSARGLTALMVLTIAMGIGASMTTLTTFRALSGDPLPGQSANVLRVQLDADAKANYAPGKDPDTQLTRFDAEALLRDRHGERQAMMTGGAVNVEPAADAPGGLKPFESAARYTTADFFPMFHTPFLYGQGWSAADDAANAPVVVLSKQFNEKLFGGANSVGRSVHAEGADLRVIGVLDDWQPVPYFFDPNVGRYRKTEGMFVPFGTALERKLGTNGSMTCWGDNATVHPHELNAPCSWIQYWVELDTPAERTAYLDYLTRYSAQQHAAGRFQRPPNPRLRDVMAWLSSQHVIPEDVRLQVWLAFGFLAVCLVNTVGLLLAKCLRRSPEIGVRRALGAPRRQIFAQFLVEAGTIGLAGGVLGLAFAAAGVWFVRHGTTRGAQFVTLDATALLITFALAIGASVVAGLLPAWKACDVSPASQLKSS